MNGEFSPTLEDVIATIVFPILFCAAGYLFLRFLKHRRMRSELSFNRSIKIGITLSIFWLFGCFFEVANHTPAERVMQAEKDPASSLKFWMEIFDRMLIPGLGGPAIGWGIAYVILLILRRFKKKDLTGKT